MMMMMMKLLQSCSWRSHSGISRVWWYSTKTLTSPSASNVGLYKSILGVEPRDSIVPILDQWVTDKQKVDLQKLQKILKQLINYRRFNKALQLSEWMNDKRYLDLVPEDVGSELMSSKRYLELLPGNVAIQLDLISRVYGLEEAEKYFSTIPDTLRVFQVYFTILSCYAYSKSLEKAEAITQKMKELGFDRKISYQVMLKLYSQTGEYKKLDSLMQEMEEKGFTCDKYDFTIRLAAYATATDIKGMEGLLLKMEADPQLTIGWNSYVVAAREYLKANLVENAMAMLKKSEQLVKADTRKIAYEVLLAQYACMGKKDEVYRIWNLYKNTKKIYNSTYLCMITALDKFDDLDGAEKVFKEWEKEKKHFDFRMPNYLITAYCRKGLPAEAESVVDRLKESGTEPDSSTWERLADGYFKLDQMDKFLETMKKAISACHSGSKLNDNAVAACMGYLMEKEDVEEMQELVNLLKEKGQFSENMYNSLGTPLPNRNLTQTTDQTGGDDQNLEGELLGDMEFKCEDIR